MKHLILLSIVLFTGLVHSLEFKSYPEFTGEIKDFLPSQLLGIESDPKKEMAIKQSDARNFINSLDKSVIQLHSSCSAVLISNTGYAVTALHCIEDLYPNQKKSVNKEIIYVNTQGQNVTANISDQSMEGHLYPFWKFNKVKYPDHEELAPVELVALGKGYPDIRKDWSATNNDVVQNLDLIKTYVDDYAIVKLNKVPKDHQCVTTATKMPQKGYLTWAAGYPVNTKQKVSYLTVKTLKDLIDKANFYATTELAKYLRKALSTMKNYKLDSWFSFEEMQHNSPFYLAIGRTFNNYEQLKNTFVYPNTNNNDQLFDLLSDPNKYIVSTSFIKTGFSGGGLFNTNGELLGINSMQPATPTFLAEKLNPMTSHVRIDYIKAQVKEKFGEEKMNEVFNCK